MEWFSNPVGHWLSGISPIRAGGGATLDFPMFDPRPMDPTLLLAAVAGFAVLFCGLIYGTHLYNRWKRYKTFEDEMKALDLNGGDETALAGMVKRFEMEEPVNVLLSPRLFDEMAVREIQRVLASPGSPHSKQRFIDAIYRIRLRTYHPEWPVDDLTLSRDALPAFREAVQPRAREAVHGGV